MSSTLESELVVNQLDLLDHDLGLLKKALRHHENVLVPLTDTSDPARHNYYETVASLFWAALDYAEGAFSIMHANNRIAFTPLHRALLEVVTTIKYLCGKDDPIAEATIFKAYAMLRELEWPLGPEAQAERESLLAAMPEELVVKAKQRVAARKGWTGMSFRNLLIATGFSDADAYSYMSEQTHSRALYNNVAWDTTPDGQRYLRLGREFHPVEAEYAANFARRLMWDAQHYFWTVFDGPNVDWNTPDPFAWLDRNKPKN